MLLQRLNKDDTAGFNYDYMGSAEYEYGSTRKGRVAIARLFLEGKMCARSVKFQEVIGKNEFEPIGVLAIGTSEALDKLGNPMKIRVTQESFRTREEDIVGWLHVSMDEEDFDPLMMIRLDMPADEIHVRVEQFLADPIKYLKEDGA